MNGVGAHEVVIESPEHDGGDRAAAGRRIWREVFRAYRDRIVDLAKDPRLEYVMVFKNHGELAGASLEHTHSQLIATPIVPADGGGGARRRAPAPPDQEALYLVRHHPPGAAGREGG